MAYATGKKALAICDRCGFRYRLHQLKKEWNGLKTCPTCFEQKHPQLEPHTSPSDAQALFQPRPDTDKEVGQGFVISNNDNIISRTIPGYQMTGSVGTVTITTT